MIWDDDSIQKSKEEQELEDDLAEELDWIKQVEVIEDTSDKHSNKCHRVEEDNMSIGTFAIVVYGLNNQLSTPTQPLPPSQNTTTDDIIIDTDSEESARDS